MMDASRQQYLFDRYLLLYVQSSIPDDGRKDYPKHVECHSKIKQIWYIGTSSWFYYRIRYRTYTAERVSLSNPRLSQSYERKTLDAPKYNPEYHRHLKRYLSLTRNDCVRLHLTPQWTVLLCTWRDTISNFQSNRATQNRTPISPTAHYYLHHREKMQSTKGKKKENKRSNVEKFVILLM